MIRTLIVDDEAPARRRLRRLLEPHREIEIIDEAADGIAALEKIEALRPDVVFLDIDMPELNGFKVVETLGARAPKIIFVTAYDEFALRAFESCALDYLLKPLTAERLAKAVARLPSATKDFSGLLAKVPPKRVAFRAGTKFVVVDPTKVSAVVARDHYSAILVDGRELLADDPLDSVIDRLSAGLLRVHRSGAINLEFLQELQHEGDRKYIAVLGDAAKTRVPVSRERLPELRERLGI